MKRVCKIITDDGFGGEIIILAFRNGGFVGMLESDDTDYIIENEITLIGHNTPIAEAFKRGLIPQNGRFKRGW